MRKKSLRVLTTLILVCLVLQPLSVTAAEQVDTARKGSIHLEYSHNGIRFPDQEIRIYRVAEMYADGSYERIAPFDRFPVRMHGFTSQKEWQDTANTLAAYITAEEIPPTATKTTNDSGNVLFSELKVGVYLVMGVTTKTDTHTYRFENFCIFLPRPLSDGRQEYDIKAKPKSSATPHPEEPKEIPFQVVKLWKDEGLQKQRPQRVTVDILKNGVVQNTVLLDADNNWTYSWMAPEGEDVWSVMEKDVPAEYTVVITSSGSSFTITNSRQVPEGNPPKTGDTFALRSWLALMSLSGILLMAFGMMQKRKRR